MKKYFFLILFFCFSTSFLAQNPEGSPVVENEEEYTFMIEGDTTAVSAIQLSEVVIVKKIKFEDRDALRKYLILKRKTKKVYPYAKMAADTLSKLVADLGDFKKKRHKKRYIKKMQRFMEERFTPELKKLTRTEGQILVKLIHRQTGETMFDLIKEYRSGFKAFVYDKTANLFNISLKREFTPVITYEDYLIEDILQRCFLDGVLEEQQPAKSLGFTFWELSDKWKKENKPTFTKK